MLDIGEERPLMSPAWVDYGSMGIKFKIRGLNKDDKDEVEGRLVRMPEDNAAGVPDIHFTSAAKTICLNSGLLDWEGVPDKESGEDVKFDRSLIAKLPGAVRSFLAYEIYLASIVSEVTKKKSSSQRMSPGTRKNTIAKSAKSGTVRKKKKRRSTSTK